MIGDRVEVVVDTGGGVQTYSIVATKAGRRVEVATSRGVVEVAEVTRTGRAVRTEISGRFLTCSHFQGNCNWFGPVNGLSMRGRTW